MNNLEGIRKAAEAELTSALEGMSKEAMARSTAEAILEEAPGVRRDAIVGSIPSSLSHVGAGGAAGATVGLGARALLGLGIRKGTKGKMGVKSYAIPALAGAILGGITGGIKARSGVKSNIREALEGEFPEAAAKDIERARARATRTPVLWRHIAGLAGLGLAGGLGAKAVGKKFLKANPALSKAPKGIVRKGAVLAGIPGYFAGRHMGDLGYRALNQDRMTDEAIRYLMSRGTTAE